MPNWPAAIALMNTSQNPPGVSCLVHSGQVAKQHESSFLYDIREGRPFRHTPHFAVGNAVVPTYIKDPPIKIFNGPKLHAAYPLCCLHYNLPFLYHWRCDVPSNNTELLRYLTLLLA